MITCDNIHNKYFNDIINLKQRSLFYSNGTGYWYTREKSFNKILEIMVLELGIIVPEKLHHCPKERIKLDVLNNRKHSFDPLRKQFFNDFRLKKGSEKEFILIIIPLLKMIKDAPYLEQII